MQAPPSAEEFELLSKAYLDYKVCAQSPGSVNSKCQLTSLTEKLQKQGISGNNALQLLNSLKQQIGWQTMHPEEFRFFYQFVFFICREQGKRNVQVAVAVDAWHGLLEGRFRLLDRWCAFMRNHYKPLVVTEDTWTQLLEFSRTVLEDLSNYDPTAAWPVALDEFAEHIRRSAKKGPDPMDFTNPWPASEQFLAAVSPRSGSKRRMPAQVAEVAEQLQHLPLGCSSTQAQHQQLAIGGPAERPHAGHHAVKRFRVAGSAPAPPAAAAGGFRSLQQHHQAATAAAAAAGAGHRGACEQSEDMMQASCMGQCRAAGVLHPMAKSMSPAGGCRLGWVAHGQQLQMGLQDNGPGAFGTGMGMAPAAAGVKAVGWGQSSACQHRACMNNLGGGQQHVAVAGPVHNRGGVEVFRCNRVNAMMQATVTDTLFFA